MPTDSANPFNARGTLRLGNDTVTVFRLPELARQGLADLDRLPFSIRVLLENALRHAGRGFVTESHVRDLASWSPSAASEAKCRSCRRGSSCRTSPGCRAWWTWRRCGTRWRG